MDEREGRGTFRENWSIWELGLQVELGLEEEVQWGIGLHWRRSKPW